MTTHFVVACALTLGLSQSACAHDSNEEQVEVCRRVQDHLTALQMEAAGVAPSHRAAHRSAMQKALSERPLADCRDSSDEQLECLLASRDLDAASRCAARE